MVTTVGAVEKIIPRPKTSSFSPEIESLRGVASFAVVMGHLYLLLFLPVLYPGRPVIPSHHDLIGVLIAGLFDPQPAVLLFFTISGLVLGRQLKKEPIGDLFSFLAYLCRRAFRLIPLMWATTFLAFYLLNLMGKLEYSLLFNTLFLNDINLNVPLWSLKVELYCSIVFPAIFLLFEFGGKIVNFALFVLLTYLSFYWQDPIYVQFLVFFHAGLIIDKFSVKVTKFMPQSYILLLLGLATMTLLLAPQFSFGLRDWNYGHWQTWVFPEILACSFILLVITSQRHSYFNAFLRLAPIRYLGKISFSIYLIHFPLFLYMKTEYTFTGTYPNMLGFIIRYLALVIFLSSLTYRWIEIPSNNLGKKLSSAILKMRRRSAFLPVNPQAE
ncbi:MULTISPECIES: acyltransferase family protein [Legionella]|uniref:Acetyltransferase n=1 Tax=Legionella drozanskii LLAP-1 TaxID=1212489 RepID=A0A0W0SMY8_9GAMM|nr:MULTISPECIES: acyltransferase [Legionella]KTC84670.1 acetyltransferase [Legionella drozanskii LLAP-1]PJE07879.1 MAG: acyltransferase [Legionella sp.]